jgi:hypothetical protein
VIILGGDLYEAATIGEDVELAKVNKSIYLHFDAETDGTQNISLVLFVTEDAVLSTFNGIIDFGIKRERLTLKEFEDKGQ